MKNEILRVLLIEDNPGDVRLIQEILAESTAYEFQLEWAENLTRGLALLTGGPEISESLDTGPSQHEPSQGDDQYSFDIVLLDLGLPESHGMETLTKALSHSREVPVVVLTGLEDEATAARAMRAGAQDYLVKGQIDSSLITRSIRYAIERHGLLEELDQARQREQQEYELQYLETLSAPLKTSVTARMYGQKTLRMGVPELFDELVDSCGDLLDQAIEQRAYKLDNRVSEKLRTMAGQLGFLKAGPRDLIEIYNTALRNKINKANPQKSRAYVEEGRILVLELMGFLALYYRNYAN